jgi:hypothetical protein
MIIGTTNLVINEIGAVYNVRIEGDGDANLFYTDATNDRIGVGIIAPTEKLDVVGNIKLSGNVVVASGQGIDFSATSGTGTSELLADYEEGTWTPVVAAGVGSLTSYTIQTGDYTKVGNIVTATFKFTITNNGTGSVFLTMTLPFTSSNESMGTTRENTVGNQGNVRTSGASSFILQYNGLYPVTTGSVVVGTVTFKV